jgi:K+-sensing histidine kinase KdpD
VVAAASFDFFLTRPNGSMRISSAEDIETALMLLTIGLVVGQLAISGHRGRSDAARARDELHRIEFVADRMAKTPGALELLDVVERQISEVLHLASCEYTLARPAAAELRTDGTVDVASRRMVDGEFALPADGVALRVTNAGADLGWLHLVPGEPVGVSLESRKVTVALAQQLGVALATAGPS